MGLNLDRVGASRYLRSVRRDEDIVNWIKANRFRSYSPASDPAIRDKVAELWIGGQVCRLMTMRSMSIVERGGHFPYAQLLNGSPLAVEKGVFAHNVMGAFQSGINHGSVQIMRDQVARRGLELPSARRAKPAAK